MLCSLDKVRQILDIADAAQQAHIKNYPEKTRLAGSSLSIISLLYGLLLIQEYDVFIKHGSVNPGGNSKEHYWIEIYFDGDVFVLDPTLSLCLGELADIPELVFLPWDEATEVYGFSEGQPIDWQQEDCPESVWLLALGVLGIELSLDKLFQQIKELSV